LPNPDDILKRIPPQNLEAEQSVLGAIFLDNRALSVIQEDFSADDFYRESHRVIYRAMLELDAKREPIDAITIANALRDGGTLEQIGGPAYIAELASIVPTAANVAHYARIVRDKAVLRALGSVATDIASSCYENPADVSEFIQEAARRIFDVCSEKSRSRGFMKMPEATRESLKQMERAYEGDRAVLGLPTGFRDIDIAIGGLESGTVIVIAARPSMGKTALACDIARNVALADKGDGVVAFFSLEMSSSQLVTRMLCSQARVDLLRARTGYLRQSDFPKLAQAAAELAETDIWIDDTAALNPVQMRNRCRAAVRATDKKLKLIIADYMQLMKPVKPRDSREREVAEISGAMKELAKEFKVPVIALSQLNRAVEDRTDKRPMLRDLRESGAIEQDADIIAFIYRDEVYNRNTKEPGIAEVILGKSRNGPTGVTKLTWIQSYTTFESYAADTVAQEPFQSDWQRNGDAR
jgi:replicative DNA helicase